MENWSFFYRSSFPRASGGVSRSRSRVKHAAAYSPRKRGWSLHFRAVYSDFHIFPAQAGVVRRKKLRHAAPPGIPRASGGVPFKESEYDHAYRYSPRLRGWSDAGQVIMGVLEVFPAQTGVFLRKWRKKAKEGSIPRVSGGVPKILSDTVADQKYSPRLRGGPSRAIAACRCLRISRSKQNVISPDGYSPRLRGWSTESHRPGRTFCVFPALAGVVPRSRATESPD